MANQPQQPEAIHHTADADEVLLALVQAVASELHPHRQGMEVALDSSLERDLGVDSLGRVELLQRLERTFGVRLPDQLFVTAETPRDLLRALHAAHAPGPPMPASAVKRAGLQETATAPTQANTLIDVLNAHAQSSAERRYLYLYGDTDEPEVVTYGELRQGAAAVATGLLNRGLRQGETVAIMLPTSRDFFDSLYGVLLAGGIPVPIYPPTRLSSLEDHARRQAGILTNALASTLITVPEAKRLARLLGALGPSLRNIVTVQELVCPGEEYAMPTIQAHDIALLQYTSGSTGRPKGVILTHANVLANIRAMGQVARTTSREVFVSWLPLYHDMGLIGACLGSLYYACPLVLMSPLAFLARPERWLWMIHTHGGTISAAPNFAYELCWRTVDDRRLEGLDLGSWRLALNGAEPISAETVAGFCERFARYGFRREAMTPVYGLAESTVGTAFSPPGRGPQIDRIRRQTFMRSGRALPAAADDPTARCVVACGQPLPGHQIRIVDATGYEVAERQVGRLEFQGPSATSGYFRNPEETRRLFHGAWLDSGDLAYIAGGDVYITGRAKDLIIRAGRNIYPHELEEAIGNLPAIRKGSVVVFGSHDSTSGTERLVVLAETRETNAAVRDRLQRQIDDMVMELLGTPADEVVLVPPHTVLKTSSGKVRRADCRARYEHGDIGGPPPAVWRQVMRLAWTGAMPLLRRALQGAVHVLYAGYAWMLVGVFAALLWLAVALAPRLSWRQGIARIVARLLLRLIGIPVHVRGREQLPSQTPYVLVVNHASYLDALVLLAALPSAISYVAKRELIVHFLPRVLFRRLGTEFVERLDPQRGVEDTRRVLQAVQQGRSLVFFAEGTFGRAPGLRPFRMGAFIVATQANVPVVPLAISGTRSILRAGQWFPHRGAVSVIFGAPIMPQGPDWAAAIALRDATRAQVLQLCGEPDLALEFEASAAGPGP